jgi:hypothetical protein
VTAPLKVANFTVRATQAQSERWKRAAEGEGYASAGAWLADAADAYLKARVRSGRPIPLAWRKGRVSVLLEGGQAVTLPGFLSPPFGALRGDAAGPKPGHHFHSLVLLSDRRIIATLRTYAQVRALAAELAPTLLRGELPDPGPVVERHVRESS